jgi:arylsulfatase A-like enzyme
VSKNVNAIIYVLDSLRSDHLSCYGYHRETTPNIDKLAKDGIIFENAYAQATWTRPCAASILTGTYPSIHQTIGINDALPSEIVTLPEVLVDEGFRAFAFSAMGNVSSALGFDKAFHSFHDLYKEESLIEKRDTSTSEREELYYEDNGKIALPLAEDINSFLFPCLDQAYESDLFIFIWAVDTHDPYKPPDSMSKFANPDYEGDIDGSRESIARLRKTRSGSGTEHLVDLYDSEIYYNDYHIGKLIQELKNTEVYDKTLFIITSDHGEAFNDYNRGEFGHGGLPYEERIRVPLICKLPSSQYRGLRIESLVQSVDIMPTILDYISRSHSLKFGNVELSGRSVLPLITGEQGSIHNCVYSETRPYENVASYYSIRSKRWKYMLIEPPNWSLENIKAHPWHFLRTRFLMDKERLYDLEEDKGELNNLAKHELDLVKEFRSNLNKWKRATNVMARNAKAGR